MRNFVRSVAAIIVVGMAVVACSSGSSGGTGSPILHQSGGITVRAASDGASRGHGGGLSIQTAGDCTCDPDWCQSGIEYPPDSSLRHFDCTDANGTTYMCLCDCSFNCSPID